MVSGATLVSRVPMVAHTIPCRFLRVIVTRIPIRLASCKSLSNASTIPTRGFVSGFNLDLPALNCGDTLPFTQLHWAISRPKKTLIKSGARARTQSGSCRR